LPLPGAGAHRRAPAAPAPHRPHRPRTGRTGPHPAAPRPVPGRGRVRLTGSRLPGRPGTAPV